MATREVTICNVVEVNLEVTNCNFFFMFLVSCTAEKASRIHYPVLSGVLRS